MKQSTLPALIISSALAGIACVAWAADQSSASAQSMAGETVKGSITSLDLTAPQPSVKLSSSDGKTWTFELDPKSTSVWKEGKTAHLSGLKKGQSVEIKHVASGGKDKVQSIRIMDSTS